MKRSSTVAGWAKGMASAASAPLTKTENWDAPRSMTTRTPIGVPTAVAARFWVPEGVCRPSCPEFAVSTTAFAPVVPIVQLTPFSAVMGSKRKSTVSTPAVWGVKRRCMTTGRPPVSVTFAQRP
ncbi:hypothetical protein HL652_16750 [Herbiconiux sp. SALV-R1]|uniref:hypothetical protein n=1 Tax=Herbiconiux sp. SALV-R1 TaxID=2735133 RepID=UPI001490D3CC|nr:hypothetical protein [Herbiconiux sp. SALV-R1]QJU55101.1 hypothetical protein HL652_16750 [Herbiconiux sp. SALV-R1]